MLKALLYSQLLATVNSFKRKSARRKNGARTAILAAIVAVYVVGCFAMMFKLFFEALCAPLCAAGLQWLYFVFVLLTATALSFVGSVFTTQSQLFDARDNELLLSMPIPPRLILASRIATLYLLNLAITLLVALPAAYVYLTTQAAGVMGVATATLLILLLPLLSLALSCAVGWVIALISSRMHNKTPVVTALSIAFLVAYFYVYSQINSYISALVANSAEIGEIIRSAVYPLYCVGDAVATQNPLSLLVALALLVLPFALVYAILSASFVRIATTRRGAARVKYVRGELKAGTQRSALLRRELRRFFSSAVYVINCSLGTIVLVIGTGALIFQRQQVLELVQGLFSAELIAPMLIGVICLVCSTNIFSAPSVSLEGCSLWIIKSLPVTARQVLMAKVYTHIILALPAQLIASAVAVILLQPTVLGALLIIITPALFNTLMALVGVCFGCIFPRLDWVSETVAVKQSAASMLTMLVGLGAALPPFGVLFVPSYIHPLLYTLLYTLLLAVGCALLYCYVVKRGTARFDAL